ncbi:MAG: translocation/assembly module TamB domain-containing protein, partial [Ignavibacteriaceae bacterium]|nr:translocation/assembly module TamB domain-containing protein [Ignavibacteriaceae bacterium]
YYIDSIKVQNYYLGSLESSAKYSDKMLKTNFSYLERKNNQTRKSLGLEGTLPIDLSFYAQDRFTRDREIDLTFNADNFDLRFASSFIPGVKNLVGSLNGSVNLAGYFDDIKNSGELKVDNSSFVLELSNLTYLLNARLEFQNDKMILSNMDVRNESKVKDAGTMIVSGQIDHENLSIQKIDLRASGSLKILDQKTKAVNPALYGDIAIKTREDIVFLSSETRTYLGMDLILKDGASITYSPTQSAFTNENDKFTYIFTSEKDRDILEQEIDSLLILSELKKEEQKLAGRIPFNFDLKLEVEKEAKVVFVLSREFKQNLTAYLGGKFEYSVINEIPFARGELTLLDGSKLDFIKTFQAKGNIRFIEELNNPFINVVATYESFYNPDTLKTSTNEYDVQIRIKLEGTADEITGNFLKGENNIEVYKSRRNANQFELDASKSASDAMFFVIVNKFPEDASIQETNLAASTAASLAGSIVGAVLNEKLGDVVRSVNVQQVGTETVFSLVGKVEEFRYEIGGTSQVFQDLTRATVKIEHPIFTPNFVVRFYRTEPPYQSSTYSEMINELGLKYTFVF